MMDANQFAQTMADHFNDSLYQGAVGHILCDKCNRFAPGAKTGRHFLASPATDPRKYRCYLPARNRKNGEDE